VLLIGQVGIVDYVIGTAVSFAILYVFPIARVTWLVGRSAGMVLSLAGMTAWLLADVLGGHAYAHPAIPYWNALVRLGFFVIVTYALATVRAAHKRQEELVSC
jgi:hypothetical protein